MSGSDNNDKNNADLREFLDANTKRGKWEAVVKKYAENPEAQRVKLTRKGDTALHLAVIDNQEQIVERLVQLICKYPNCHELLETSNERQNNPLHLAAALGSARMCHVIGSAHEKLVDARNMDDETPMFLAAVYGHRNAFYCLYYFCRSDLTRIATNCRVKTNGDTVLHCALGNDHFDLAFQLINMNKDAMSWVNEQGFTPLHVLASKPTSFKSGAHTSGWWKIVYYCTFVDPLKPQPIETLKEAWKKGMPQKPNQISYSFPPNYDTCIHFFISLWDAFLKVSTLKPLLNKKKNTKDFEKDVNVESGNFDIVDESHECMDEDDARLLNTNPSATDSEASITHFPENYSTCIDFFQIVFTAIMIILGLGSTGIRKIREKKQKHTWSVQVMEKLLEFAPSDNYGHDGKTPMISNFHTDKDAGITHPYSLVDEDVQFSSAIDSKPNDSEKPKYDLGLFLFCFKATETAMLLAAKHGVIEIVKGMLERFPLAIHDTRKDKKNVVLLAAEYRQPDVYIFLLKQKHDIETLFRAVDVDGNSALHLAAAASKCMIWHITGDTLQMQWEVKWYKFIEESMPVHFFGQYNKKGKTAISIFHETHMDMVKGSGEWLTKTSKSCSVVGTLIVTVAFSSAASIPGGFDHINGSPILEKQQSFFIFAISSLIALCLSSTSVATFLAILTYRFDTNDFRSTLPWKLFIGFSSLFFSIISMLISFCAGHYFLIDHRLQNVAVLLYILTFLPVAFIFVISKLPLYYDVLKAIFKTVPRRSANVVLSDPLPPTSNNNPCRGKFEVALIHSEIKSDDVSLVIFSPTTQGSYPVILLLPGCVESFHSNFLRVIASHGLVIVAPELKSTIPTESGRTGWVCSEQEMVEGKVSKVYVETRMSLGLGYESPSRPFSEVIGFNPMPGTKFCIPHSQIQAHAHQSFHISTPILETQFVISNLCGSVKLLDSTQSS